MCQLLTRHISAQSVRADDPPRPPAFGRGLWSVVISDARCLAAIILQTWRDTRLSLISTKLRFQRLLVVLSQNNNFFRFTYRLANVKQRKGERLILSASGHQAPAPFAATREQAMDGDASMTLIWRCARP